MMTATFLRCLIFNFSLLAFVFAPIFAEAESPTTPLTLKQTIQLAIAANLNMKQAQERIRAAEANKNVSRSNFFPTFSAQYNYMHRNRPYEEAIPGTGTSFIITPQDEYTFVTAFSQPIFTGFSLINQYKIASLGLDEAEIRAKLTRQDVILDAKNAYFRVLKAQKLVEVQKQTVEQITSQKEVAENFYQVGMSPLNDLLQAQVELADAKQNLIVAQNNLEIAKSQLNLVLRRPVNQPITIENIVNYVPFQHGIEYSLSEADQNRLEIYVANLQVEIAQKQVNLAQGNYWPTINLTGAYTRLGDDYNVSGGEGVIDPISWNIQATATWNFWEWGRTSYGIKEKLSRLSEAKFSQTQVLDNINLEVKEAYLRTKEAEKNIVTVEKAIEQAKENYRMTQERYKEQVATSTDVLTAQTLLTRTLTNYYNALYDFKISKARLFRAMGQEVWE